MTQPGRLRPGPPLSKSRHPSGPLSCRSSQFGMYLQAPTLIRFPSFPSFPLTLVRMEAGKTHQACSDQEDVGRLLFG